MSNNTAESLPIKRFKTAADILALDDLQTEDVYIESWDTYVRIRTLTASERDAFEAGMFKGKGKSRELNLANLRARLVCMAAVDENGDPIFTPEQTTALGHKSAAALDKLYSVAQRLNGLLPEDVEEMTKN